MNETKQYGVVLVTAESEEQARAIASSLVKENYAACVSMMPVQSVYTWQEEVHSDPEWQLMIKTDLNQYSQVEARIKELHSYEVPEIIALPIQAGLTPYLNWIGENVAPQ
ncbi:divalent-cation tolerance protein CutA [Euhalothece natronophila Z-M001]|uniref:Divalent-cation tolerance protein CutA n=1 Tax=Euhalothece natronophila Z-M001 TaxID=522448 RepID=A0A5B8NLM8_9CHRO|nr:divalent-cation tolerance protein CutA [Euhalothece natronophila]QDZ39441.1 divalent-cation tolerance protein CutA [Euhalothece natronophila Z-M001]